VKRSLKRLPVVGAWMFALAPEAHAHLTTSGLGPFYDGLTHPFVTPEDLLPLVALSVLAGLRGARFGRFVLFALPGAWLVGSAVGLVITSPVLIAATRTVVTITLGALVAADVRLPLTSVASLAIVLGLLSGGLSGMDLARTQSGALIVAGGACAFFVVVALLAACVVSLRSQWARIATRVAGSWIAASGLFMLGWALHKG
jgi:urease accessory protein